MKTKLSKALCCIFLITIVMLTFYSCKKSNDPENTPGFTLTYDSNTYAAYEYSASITSLGPYYIKAHFLDGLFRRAEFNLASFNVGDYYFGGVSGSVVRFIDNAGNPTDNAMSGSLTVTKNENNLMSGNFSLTVKDISNLVHTVTGSFSKVPISF